eukprot:scaffold31780_cov29-Phaeocystis_antarctica.AAC.2
MLLPQARYLVITPKAARCCPPQAPAAAASAAAAPRQCPPDAQPTAGARSGAYALVRYLLLTLTPTLTPTLTSTLTSTLTPTLTPPPLPTRKSLKSAALGCLACLELRTSVRYLVITPMPRVPRAAHQRALPSYHPYASRASSCAPA